MSVALTLNIALNIRNVYNPSGINMMTTCLILCSYFANPFRLLVRQYKTDVEMYVHYTEFLDLDNLF